MKAENDKINGADQINEESNINEKTLNNISGGYLSPEILKMQEKAKEELNRKKDSDWKGGGAVGGW